ncbi:phosphoenolpyruvate carboxykinase (ATP) [Membranihabitans marinus]|uniref:phosphoenolpyruvate carboxykinase (ATP) n=1 Tax=Membranihabitans marinus TaxID=1227546 RepID=UPI001F018A21|nr:phosphoenolpyruvate carboxykinase (ATP) [Membranihabitans marinus]
MIANKNLNLVPAALVQKTIERHEGRLSDAGALCVNTGKFTGRSPKDRFIVEDSNTKDSIDWGPINIAIAPHYFDMLYDKMTQYMESIPEYFTRQVYACASSKYKLHIKIHTEYPWQNIFVHNMFLRPSEQELAVFKEDWTVLSFPSVLADPNIHGTRQENFSIINFTKKIILIGGTAYTGEIKKGIFSVLNYILPEERKVLSMHCSANVGPDSDTALFFGLSGTGKTTLSNDEHRRLIGDDEHGWSTSNIYNLEGGCYAKTIDLSPGKEPQIFKAIKFGALLENIGFKADGVTPDYSDKSITENTRVSYPINHIENIMYNSRGDIPRNIFFLTCDAFGVLPPISKLNNTQAMYHFLSGYTAKIAGTETGITEPQATFSACFGSPFLPLHPTRYADLLGEKLEEGIDSGDGKIKVWLVNTGWTGGPYGVGSRIELVFTRNLIKAALSGALNDVTYKDDNIFGLQVPQSCPDVPNAILNPRDTWRNESEYDEMAKNLSQLFKNNFKKFEERARQEVIDAGPK